MFNKSAVNYCLLGVVAVASAACSTTESRRSEPVREALPTIPVPQQRSAAIPQNRGVYAPPAFEEYKPRSTGPYAEPEETFPSYVPEPSFESFTTPLEESPPAIVERLSPKPVVAEAPVAPVEPAKPVVEDFSKNELDIDPFADIPERETLAVTRNNSAAKPAPPKAKKSISVAANALLIGAKAEAAVGRYDSAINKVERALRIEPDSPLLWYQLGNFNYGKGRYDQAISLSRKSLRMSTGNRSLVAQNLDLMSKAATKTGNTRVFKEVLDYKRLNP
jgi:tetratricopeptide (TPR) repeat protein